MTEGAAPSLFFGRVGEEGFAQAEGIGGAGWQTQVAGSSQQL